MKRGVLIFWLIIVALIVAGIGMSLVVRSSPSKLDPFAQCLKDKGVVFYGAFWCPHCQATKKMFGTAARLLPYVECSTPDGKEQLQICKDKDIKSYPTWTFPNSTTTLTGERTLQELSDASGCALPQ
ncbi:MAG: protein disulfide isomerase family protein [bacterium]|nr:protein disulfide isomerase family protein [bacterium]